MPRPAGQVDMEVAQLDAYDHGAQLAVLRDDSGAITEGPGFNVFAHVDGRWLTPASGTLAGITRRSLIELAAEAGDQVQEGQLSDGDLRRATEVAITSTAGGIMPVTLIDGQPVGTGTPGPRTTSLREWYWARHEDPRFSSPVRYDGQRLQTRPEHRTQAITLGDEENQGLRAPDPPYWRIGAGAAVVAVVSRGSDGLVLEPPAGCSRGLAY